MTYVRQAGQSGTREPVGVQSPNELDDVVVFELPTPRDGRGLADRLEDRWPCNVEDADDVTVVGVFLSPTHGLELATMLRDVERWAANQPLEGILFWVDGRCYVLPALPGAGAAPH